MISFLFRVLDTVFRVFCSFANAIFTVISKLLSAVFWPVSRLLDWELDSLSSWWPLFCAAWVVLILLILLIIAGVALSRWRKEK